MMKFALSSLGLSLLMTLTLASQADAKGLQDLTKEKPSDEKAAKTEDGKPQEAEVVASAPEPKAGRQNKVFVATTWGWANAKRSEGDWEASGLGDILVGYRLGMDLGAKTKAAATFRYVPMAVAAKIDDRSYRGVLETYNFGMQFDYAATPKITAVGSAELGYVLVNLYPLDTIPVDDEHNKNGASFTIGGGADWQLFGNDSGFKAGPRLFVGAGTVTSFQLSGGAVYSF